MAQTKKSDPNKGHPSNHKKKKNNNGNNNKNNNDNKNKKPKEDKNMNTTKKENKEEKTTKEIKEDVKLPEVKDVKEILDKNQITINLKPEITRADFGKEVWISLDDLVLDEDTQRSPMENHVKKIAKNLDPKAFGRISVSLRSDGKYYVTDGWHRTLACKSLGMKEVPCIVIENKTDEIKKAKKNDALQFLKINENSSSVSAIDKYKIGVSGEVEEWLRVKECVESNGLKVGTSASRVNAVASIYKYVNSSKNPETIAKKMDHMKLAIGILNDITGVLGITNISINAMCLFVREYISEGMITRKDAMNAFSKVDLRQMITNAQTLKNTNTGGNVITSLAYLLYKEYNNHTKGEKLPPRFEI